MAMISVIVPIYNCAIYLEQCIESLVNQSFTDLEIILVDDGSTDSCPQICDTYKEKDTRIKVIHKENGGPVSARKAGLQIAGGQYIGFADGDDWLEADMYERMYQKISKQRVDIVMCGRYEDTGKVHRKIYQGIPEGRYDKNAMIQQIYPRMIVNDAFFEWGLFPGMWDKLFKKECLEAFQMSVDDRLTMGDDAACTYPCLLNADSIYIMRECLYHYRQISNSIVKTNSDACIERKRFQILYESVNRHLEKDSRIYDLREQWKEYLLFLMIPRADYLYDGVDKLEYLFPFPNVKKGSDIILYGAGTYGQRLYNYLQKTNFCKVTAWVDRNAPELLKQGFSVIMPQEIASLECDTIVVASSFAKTRKEIYRELIEKYPKHKVNIMDEKLVKCDETMKAFGLMR